jgi:CelD/BcsL family acetyltransferase involved in cellulose biosynthesis
MKAPPARGYDGTAASDAATLRPDERHEIALHVGADALHRFGEPLDALVAATGAPVTAQRLWAATWLSTHQEWVPLTITVHRQAELVAAAFLARRRRRLHDDVRPAGAGASDEVRLPAKDARAAAALAEGIRAAVRAGGRPWRLLMRDLPPDDRVVACLLPLLPRAAVRQGDLSPRLCLDRGPTLRSYVSRNHHQQSRRLRNRLERAGTTLQVAQLTEPAAVAAVLPEVVRVCRARDHDLRGFSRLDEGAELAFFTRIVLAHARERTLQLTTLRLDDRLAAYVICFVDGDVWRMWNCRFDPLWAEFGPGRLSHDEALSAALAAGCRTYDWMRGDEAYKDALSNHAYRVQDLHATSSVALWVAFEFPTRARVALRDAKNRSQTGTALYERARPLLRRFDRLR